MLSTNQETIKGRSVLEKPVLDTIKNTNYMRIVNLIAKRAENYYPQMNLMIHFDLIIVSRSVRSHHSDRFLFLLISAVSIHL